MITVTIEGPVGAGKTTIGRVIVAWCEDNEKTYLFREDVTDAVISRNMPDVLIVTKPKKT